MLPDFGVPYKHYNEEIISGVLDGIVNLDDDDSEVYPYEMTMLRCFCNTVDDCCGDSELSLC